MVRVYRLKLRVLNLGKGTGHKLHGEPVVSQLFPLSSSGHPAQSFHKGNLQVVIYTRKREGGREINRDDEMKTKMCLKQV